MSSKDVLSQAFTEKARAVSAFVSEVADTGAAIDYVMDLCERKEACQLLAAGCESELSSGAEVLCDAKQRKIIAAPGLGRDVYESLADRCAKAGFDCIDAGMRNHLAGIDIGFTWADYGIAETGTLMIDCPGEDLRLATMISEFHVCVLPKSKIRKTSEAVERMMLTRMNKAPNYMAYITGASRTADIERVLALGVHGPLELHILLLEDA